MLLRELLFLADAFTTEEKEDVKGDADVLDGRAAGSDGEPKSVDKGVRPRWAPGVGAGRPQAECCGLRGRTPEGLFVPDAVEF